MKFRKLKGIIGALALAIGLASVARADVPSDSFVLTVTPTGDRGVIIGSATVAMNGAGVVFGSTQTSNAIPVTSTGSLVADYEIGASAFTGGVVWTFSTDGTNDQLNECIVRALFKERGAAAPADGEYVAVTSLLSSVAAVEVGDAAPGAYEGAACDVDDMTPEDYSDLYIRVVLPENGSDLIAKNTTITVTAVAQD